MPRENGSKVNPPPGSAAARLPFAWTLQPSKDVEKSVNAMVLWGGTSQTIPGADVVVRSLTVYVKVAHCIQKSQAQTDTATVHQRHQIEAKTSNTKCAG
jgi:hypothetical protein